MTIGSLWSWSSVSNHGPQSPWCLIYLPRSMCERHTKIKRLSKVNTSVSWRDKPSNTLCLILQSKKLPKWLEVWVECRVTYPTLILPTRHGSLCETNCHQSCLKSNHTLFVPKVNRRAVSCQTCVTERLCGENALCVTRRWVPRVSGQRLEERAGLELVMNWDYFLNTDKRK